MAITISGENNNDKILASDGVIDSLSSLNISGIATATTFVGNLTGNVTGDVGGNLTGNVTGNINNTTLLLQTGGYERVRITSSGQVGIGTEAGYGDAKLTVEGTAALTNNDTTLQIKDNVNDSAAGRGGNIGFSGYVNGTQRTFAGIGGLKSASGTGNFAGDLALYTRVDGQAELNERLRITADGNIGFNRDTVNAGDNETQLATATPNRFVFNNHYSNGYTDSSLKLYLFNDGATRQGFTSGPLYDLQYHSSGHATHAKHSFFTQNVEALRINASGLVTKPKHPAFFVTMNGSDQTTSASNIMPFDTVVHNNGDHFKTSGADIYNFVCPVDGYYFFGGQVWLKHGSGTGNHARWEIWRDTQILALAGWHQNGVNFNDMSSSASVTVYCTAGAKVYMEADMDLTYWRGGSSQPHTFFHGHLIG